MKKNLIYESRLLNCFIEDVGCNEIRSVEKLRYLIKVYCVMTTHRTAGSRDWTSRNNSWALCGAHSLL